MAYSIIKGNKNPQFETVKVLTNEPLDEGGLVLPSDEDEVDGDTGGNDGDTDTLGRGTFYYVIHLSISPSIYISINLFVHLSIYYLCLFLYIQGYHAFYGQIFLTLFDTGISE